VQCVRGVASNRLHLNGSSLSPGACRQREEEAVKVLVAQAHPGASEVSLVNINVAYGPDFAIYPVFCPVYVFSMVRAGRWALPRAGLLHQQVLSSTDHQPFLLVFFSSPFHLSSSPENTNAQAQDVHLRRGIPRGASVG
jgi:hypothetical protein